MEKKKKKLCLDSQKVLIMCLNKFSFVELQL